MSVLHQIRTGDQISRLIANNANFLSPLRVRHAAQAEKKPVGLFRPLVAGLFILQRDRTQGLIAVKGGDLGQQQYLNASSGPDAIDEILRDALLQ